MHFIYEPICSLVIKFVAAELTIRLLNFTLFNQMKYYRTCDILYIKGD